MRNYWYSGVLALLLLILAACGSSATAVPTAEQAPTQAPAVTQAPASTGQSATLVAYAAEHADAPGAIYFGDINQLVGPAVTPDQGDFDGNVPLDAL